MRQGQQRAAEQLAIGGPLADPRRQQVIEVARHQVALQHVGQFQRRAPQLLEDVAGLVGQADLHEHQQAGLHRRRVEVGVVAGDHCFALEPAHALGARGGRQPDPLTQLGEGNAALGLQDAQDLAVDLVQFAGTGGHGRQPWGMNCRRTSCRLISNQANQLVSAVYTSPIMVPARSSAGNDRVGEVPCES
ncbi:hypothetical protein G6F59_015646 [Rhizopus arrhizus]|nr:hypothetical protein G6F59_015646 [Rhizopus arrhizus]